MGVSVFRFLSATILPGGGLFLDTEVAALSIVMYGCRRDTGRR
jgi:hypothetical protein